jgi:hypothetical protein
MHTGRCGNIRGQKCHEKKRSRKEAKIQGFYVQRYNECGT